MRPLAVSADFKVLERSLSLGTPVLLCRHIDVAKGVFLSSHLHFEFRNSSGFSLATFARILDTRRLYAVRTKPYYASVVFFSKQPSFADAPHPTPPHPTPTPVGICQNASTDSIPPRPSGSEPRLNRSACCRQFPNSPKDRLGTMCFFPYLSSGLDFGPDARQSSYFVETYQHARYLTRTIWERGFATANVA